GATFLLSDQPVEVALVDGTGHFEVSLVATETTRPGTFYTVLLETPGTGGEFTFLSVLPGQLRVPAGTGPFNLADLMKTSANPAMAWAGPIYPSDAPPAAGTWWLVTDPASPN